MQAIQKIPANYRCRDWRRFDRKFFDQQRAIGARLRPEVSSQGIADAQYTANPSTNFPSQSVNHRWDFFVQSILNAGNAYISFLPGVSPTNIGASPFTIGGLGVTAIPATGTELMGTQFATSTAAGVQSAGLVPNANLATVSAVLGNYQNGGVLRFRLALNQTTNTRIWFGLIGIPASAATYQANVPNTFFIGFRYSTQLPSPDTRYQCVVNLNSVTQFIVGENGGSHVDLNTHIFEMQFGTNITFLIDNAIVGSLNFAGIPTNTAFQPGICFDNVVTGNTSKWTFFYLKGNLNSSL